MGNAFSSKIFYRKLAQRKVSSGSYIECLVSFVIRFAGNKRKGFKNIELVQCQTGPMIEHKNETHY